MAALPFVVMSVLFWGTIFPAWLSAIGSLVAAAIGITAFVKSIRTEGGVQTLRTAANRPSVINLPGELPLVSWTAWHEQKSHYKLRNDSTNSGATVELLSFEDVTPNGGNDAYTAIDFPVVLQPNETIPFSIEKTLVSPAVTAIRLKYRHLDHEEEKFTTIYV